MTRNRLVTLDAETFYDPATKYSLSSMSNTAYIRDKRFQEIGWAVRDVPMKRHTKQYPTQWHDGRDYAAMQRWLRGFKLDAPGTYVVAHNGATFDTLILAWKHGIHPWVCLDTLQMSRALYGKGGPGGKGNSLKALAEYFGLGEKGTEVVDAMGMRLEDFSPVALAKYGRYCENDVNLTEALARILIPKFTDLELRMMSMIAGMSARARIEVDVGMCERALVLHREHKADTLVDTAAALGVTAKDLKSALMSNPKFAQVLTALGVDPPMKLSKTTGKPTFAFAKNDPEMQELAESDDELVADIVGLRTGVKSTIMETRLEHFIAVGSGGPMPAGLRYGGAHTGRASADGSIHKCQLHNLPSRGAEGKRNALRLSLRAPEGHVLCGADSSQIEVRTEATLADEQVLLAAFNRDEDPYLALGPTLFGRAITKADKAERNITKAAVLAAGYAQGAAGFYAHCKRSGVDISEDMAARTINAYRGLHTNIVSFWRDCDRAIRALAGHAPAFYFGKDDCLYAERGWITLPSGRRIEYRDTEKAHNSDTGHFEYTFFEKHKGFRKYLYGGRLTENLTQAVAYDVLAWQATYIEDELDDVPVLFTHDELVYLPREEDLSHYKKVIEKCMSTCPSWLPDVRLACEFGAGKSYADV